MPLPSEHTEIERSAGDVGCQASSLLSRLPRWIVIERILEPVRKEPRDSETGAIAYLRLRKFGLSDRKARGLIWSVAADPEGGRMRARR